MANNFTAKDISGATRTFAAKDIGSGVLVRRDYVAPSPELADAPTPLAIASAASTNATSVKASSGVVFGINLTNLSMTSVRFVKFYDKASAPAPATDSALLLAVFPIPAGASRDITLNGGLQFSTGIAYAIVDGVASTNNTAVGANDVIGVITYK